MRYRFIFSISYTPICLSHTSSPTLCALSYFMLQINQRLIHRLLLLRRQLILRRTRETLGTVATRRVRRRLPRLGLSLCGLLSLLLLRGRSLLGRCLLLRRRRSLLLAWI
jgi:hypothetical protein